MMTEHEADQAVQAAFDVLDARSNLKSALAIFIEAAERAQTYLKQSVPEPEHSQEYVDMLENELSWATSLRYTISTHDSGGRI